MTAHPENSPPAVEVVGWKTLWNETPGIWSALSGAAAERGVGEDEEQQMLADAGAVIEKDGLGHNKRLYVHCGRTFMMDVGNILHDCFILVHSLTFMAVGVQKVSPSTLHRLRLWMSEITAREVSEQANHTMSKSIETMMAQI